MAKTRYVIGNHRILRCSHPNTNSTTPYKSTSTLRFDICTVPDARNNICPTVANSTSISPTHVPFGVSRRSVSHLAHTKNTLIRGTTNPWLHPMSVYQMFVSPSNSDRYNARKQIP